MRFSRNRPWHKGWLNIFIWEVQKNWKEGGNMIREAPTANIGYIIKEATMKFNWNLIPQGKLWQMLQDISLKNCLSQSQGSWGIYMAKSANHSLLKFFVQWLPGSQRQSYGLDARAGLWRTNVHKMERGFKSIWTEHSHYLL